MHHGHPGEPGSAAKGSGRQGHAHRRRASAFDRVLVADNITRTRTEPCRPQTNGKLERYNRTLLNEWAYARPHRSEAARTRTRALARWLHTYNHHRHHTAIGGPPVSRVNNVVGQTTQEPEKAGLRQLFTANVVRGPPTGGPRYIRPMHATDAAALPVRRGAPRGPLYAQVSEELERLVMRMHVGDTRPLPPESHLMEQFGVSRGTLRRAVNSLVRDGLLRIEPGRGTFVNMSAHVRRLVWERLAAVAEADSRFDYDFKRFVPDFDGRERCDDKLRRLPLYQDARQIFITPDNSLESLRALALNDGKRIVVPTYGGNRGMYLLDPTRVRKPQRDLAATLDGMERSGTHLDLEDLRALDSIDLLVTGAVATTRTGVHLGGGEAHLDVEWGILRETGLVSADTPVVAVVHGVQVIEDYLQPGPLDCPIDVIITPDEVITPASPKKPPGLDFSRLKLESVEKNEYLRELTRRRPDIF